MKRFVVAVLLTMTILGFASRAFAQNTIFQQGTPFGNYSGAGNIWGCSLNGLAATLTQCQAAPSTGLRAYITDITVVTTTATAGTYQIRYGTGTNCATATTNLFPSFSGTFTAPVTGVPQTINFVTPLYPATSNAICVIGTATNTINIQLQGFLGP